ncbi:hypothetical protein RBB50_012867 [Rhinocladiella similis]
MATVEASSTAQEGPGHHSHSQDVFEITATVFNADPTTPTRPIALDPSTPQTQRRSLRTRKPTERVLNIDEGDDEAGEGDGEETDTRQKTRGKRGRPPKSAKTQPGMEGLAPAIAQLLRLAEDTGRQNEAIMQMTQQNEMRMGVIEERIDRTTPAEAQLVARVGQLEDQMRIMTRTMQGYGELVQKYESKIEELLKIGLENADQIRTLETQNQSMMKLIKDSANEQVKVTQSWAQVVAGATGTSRCTPTTPASRLSLPTTSVNPSSSASQPSNLSRSAIMVDLGRTSEQVTEFARLKDKVNESLKKHDSTKDVVCTGVQRRAGGEDQVKITFAS